MDNLSMYCIHVLKECDIVFIFINVNFFIIPMISIEEITRMKSDLSFIIYQGSNLLSKNTFNGLDPN